jgi:hypothetical protein
MTREADTLPLRGNIGAGEEWFRERTTRRSYLGLGPARSEIARSLKQYGKLPMDRKEIRGSASGREQERFAEHS